ncbi:MAG: hypothetical protein M9947_09020 [Thermomicrobiales bacterium]|nr:hypothetical protein [Thermomicrobiales bacterium]
MEKQLEFRLVGIATPERFPNNRTDGGKIGSHQRAKDCATESTHQRSQKERQQESRLIPLFFHDDIALILSIRRCIRAGGRARCRY